MRPAEKVLVDNVLAVLSWPQPSVNTLVSLFVCAGPPLYDSEEPGISLRAYRCAAAGPVAVPCSPAVPRRHLGTARTLDDPPAPNRPRKPYRRLKVRLHLPQRISPGLYPPIRDLVRQ